MLAYLGRMPVLEHAQWSLNYSVKGDGTAMVLLHGFCESSAMWAPFVELLEHRFQIILVDLPGFGGSPTPNDNYTLADLVDPISAILANEGIGAFFLLGHSMGGYLALAIAVKLKNRVLALGMINSHPFADNEQKRAARRKAIAFVKKYDPIRYAKQLFIPLFSLSYRKENPNSMDIFVQHLEKTKKFSVELATMAMMNRKDRSFVMQNADYPVFLVSGKLDESATAEMSLKQAALSNKSRLLWDKLGGHMTVIEQPARCAMEFIQFYEDFFTNPNEVINE